MAFSPSFGVLAAIERHFDDPRVSDASRLTMCPDGSGGAPLSLTPAEARRAVCADADPALSALIWREVLSAARAEGEPQGAAQLLLIYLVLTRLRGTAYRICARLRAERADVEAEMVLALLEELQAVDPASSGAAQDLAAAACSAAWRYARAGLREVPSASLDNIARGDGRAVTDNAAEMPESGSEQHVESARPDGRDGLRAALRFSVPAKSGDDADTLGAREVTRRTGRPRRRRRTGTLVLRPGARRR
ncbi:hypothetical protein [Streptomyces qinglanensis]|uniref:hypothetical protein n=1 Tax=Streptomyces qinglanensis TaxID=943816 RepID=UPI003D7450C3